MNADPIPQNARNAQFAAAHDGRLDAGILKRQSIHGITFIGGHRRFPKDHKTERLPVQAKKGT
jgi:hypothetical protein